MSNRAVEINNLSKIYRVVPDARYRILHLLGLPIPKRRIDEFQALKDISLNIERGEKVGLIGRNGAGKSTLLKTICGQVKCTSGSVKVFGNVQALMELGTGFHPDFTGRQNALSAFAYQGITPRESRSKIEEVMIFSELGGFFDKPVKTYSAGMYARLAFSVATAIEPEILIVDEILGAGDAYFNAKCIERVRRLTSSGSTTLLFVSHDLSSVQAMCDRCIWVDQGQILADGPPMEVGKMYLASIRDQETKRLALENQRAQRVSYKKEDDSLITFRLVGENDVPMRKHLITKFLLRFDNFEIPLHVGDIRDNDSSNPIWLATDKSLFNWGSPTKEVGQSGRLVGEFGGKYGHAPIHFRASTQLEEIDEFSVEIEHLMATEDGAPICVQLWDGEKYLNLGQLSKSLNTITTDRFRFERTRPIDVFGTQKVRIKDVVFRNADNDESLVFFQGEPLQVDLTCECLDHSGPLTFVVAIYSESGDCVTQVFSEPVENPGQSATLMCRASFNPLLLGPKTYFISLGLFENLQAHHKEGIEPQEIHDRRFKIKVLKSPNSNWEFGLVKHPISWKITNDNNQSTQVGKKCENRF